MSKKKKEEDWWHLSLLEICLIQVIFYGILWIASEYVASLIFAIIPPIILFVLVISLIVEKIEKSKVPRSYFTMMFISFLIPTLMGIAYLIMSDFNLAWLQ